MAVVPISFQTVRFIRQFFEHVARSAVLFCDERRLFRRGRISLPGNVSSLVHRTISRSSKLEVVRRRALLLDYDVFAALRSVSDVYWRELMVHRIPDQGDLQCSRTDIPRSAKR